MFGDEQYPVNLKEWIREQRMELRDKAYEDDNARYLKVLNEISDKEEKFIANCDDLLNKAAAHSVTFNSTAGEDKEHLKSLLSGTVFFIDFD